MIVLCDLTTKRIVSFSRWSELSFNPLTHVSISVLSEPDFELEILNDTNDGIRLATPAELLAYADAATLLVADIETQFSQPLKAFALVVLSEINILRVIEGLPERTVAQLKAAVLSRL